MATMEIVGALAFLIAFALLVAQRFNRGRRWSANSEALARQRLHHRHDEEKLRVSATEARRKRRGSKEA